MARLTNDADYDAGETSGNVPRPRLNFGNDHADNGPRTRCVPISLPTNVTIQDKVRFYKSSYQNDQGNDHADNGPRTSMKSRSDDVCHSKDEGLGELQWGRRTASRGLLRAIQQSYVCGNPPLVSGKATSRIPSNQISFRNGESCHNISLRNFSKPSFSSYYAKRLC
ncbi:unnamed protein product [Protopolystoma xenopodis]|uniref:Uncharacterized protein n=1 Tax=Protopolystoma xenopodis TaxID=117903 RepID=A0A3S5CPL0_9PLAT|nr:unnamed protein product [Protopolystoma xenopodis]